MVLKQRGFFRDRSTNQAITYNSIHLTGNYISVSVQITTNVRAFVFTNYPQLN